MKKSASYLCVLLTVAVAVACSCAGPAHPSGDKDWPYPSGEKDWPVVAGIDGGDRELQQAIKTALNARGIPCLFEGSLFYDVRVPRSRRAEATRLLRHDPRLKGKEIHFRTLDGREFP